MCVNSNLALAFIDLVFLNYKNIGSSHSRIDVYLSVLKYQNRKQVLLSPSEYCVLCAEDRKLILI